MGFYRRNPLFFFGHSLTSWNTSMYSQLLCLLFLVTTIHSNYAPKPFSQTYNNMKHSHCSSLLVFVHTSNLAGCNSEDILEKAYQKSCYFQSSQDWAWDFKDVTNGTCWEVAALCCIGSTSTYTGFKNWEQQKPDEEERLLHLPDPQRD